MQAVARFDASMNRPVIREISASDRNWVLEQHKEIYMLGHGFDDSFETLVAKILDDFFDKHDSTYERGWIAEEDGRPLGAVFCMRIDERTAQLRLFFLISEARGKGLGREMMQTLIRFAKIAGYQEIRLWTHQSHEAACALYRATGWRCIEEKPTVSFGKNEVIESYVLGL